MLRAVFGARPRPFYFASPASFADRLGVGGVRPVVGVPWRRCSHRQTGTCVGGAASIWHVILPSSSSAGGIEILRRGRWRCGVPVREEGSWNAAWDVRPARWLHGPHSAWLLFGVCACRAPFDHQGVADLELVVADHDYAAAPLSTAVVDEEVAAVAAGGGDDADYRVTGVAADGRCLFRAIVHGSCLSCRKEAPDETRQQELADDLRARVADELLKRREEIEQFIEEDFDTYLKNIRQPYTWGGEPELLMATHVLQAPISVFTKDRRSGGLEKIASYGQEYEKDGEVPIRVLFHGYGHYDVLETL